CAAVARHRPCRRLCPGRRRVAHRSGSTRALRCARRGARRTARAYPRAAVSRGCARAGARQLCARDRACRHASVALLVETSPGTLAPSMAQARALVDGLPPGRVGVLYDPGNMAIEGHIEPGLAV